MSSTEAALQVIIRDDGRGISADLLDAGDDRDTLASWDA